MTNDKHVKIAFELDQDEHGWPPVTTETLWAIDLGNETYQIDNIPFHVPLLAYGDVVTAYRKYGDMLYYKETVRDSEHSTLRIFFSDKSKIKVVYDELKVFGCNLEGGEDYMNLTSIDLPPSVAFKNVANYLQEMENAGFISYEESCISEHHRNQTR